MRTIEQAKTLLESLRPLQDAQTDGHIFPCPRCGQDRMQPKAANNALSRRANVYICETCGMDEAMKDMAGISPFPLNEWAMVQGFDEDDTDDT